jgi:hypothetical protein
MTPTIQCAIGYTRSFFATHPDTESKWNILLSSPALAARIGKGDAVRKLVALLKQATRK